MIFEPLQGWGLPHHSGQPGPMLDHSCRKQIFPNIQSEPPLMQLEAVSSHPSAGYLGEEINPHLTTPSCQVVVESDEVSSEPHQRRVQSNNLFPTPSGHTISETSQDATGRVYLELQHV